METVTIETAHGRRWIVFRDDASTHHVRIPRGVSDGDARAFVKHFPPGIESRFERLERSLISFADLTR